MQVVYSLLQNCDPSRRRRHVQYYIHRISAKNTASRRQVPTLKVRALVADNSHYFRLVQDQFSTC